MIRTVGHMHTYTTAFEWTDENRELLVENPVRIAGYVLAEPQVVGLRYGEEV